MKRLESLKAEGRIEEARQHGLLHHEIPDCMTK
jgi:hypothetical protein